MEKKQKNPEIMTVLLRLLGGGYFIYLAYQLYPELMVSSGGRNLIQGLCMIVFFAVGAVLAGWSIKKLICKEFHSLFLP